MYIFGDSYSDSGAGFVATNGPTALALLAGRLGGRLATPDTIGSRGDSVNFAVAGAGTGAENGRRVAGALIGFGMRNQVGQFRRLVRRGRLTFDSDTAIFFIAGGLNDGRISTEQSAANLHLLVRQLHGAGARRFYLATLPQSIPKFAATARRLNPAYAELVRTLQAGFPDSQVLLSPWGAYFDEVMRSPKIFGVVDTDNACAGREIFGEDPAACSDPDSRFYYYPDHPSAVVHRIVADKLAHDLLGAR